MYRLPNVSVDVLRYRYSVVLPICAIVTLQPCHVLCYVIQQQNGPAKTMIDPVAAASLHSCNSAIVQ